MSEAGKEVFQAWELLGKVAGVGVGMTLTNEPWAQRRAPQGFWVGHANPTIGAEAGRAQALGAPNNPLTDTGSPCTQEVGDSKVAFATSLGPVTHSVQVSLTVTMTCGIGLMTPTAWPLLPADTEHLGILSLTCWFWSFALLPPPRPLAPLALSGPPLLPQASSKSRTPHRWPGCGASARTGPP